MRRKKIRFKDIIFVIFFIVGLICGYFTVTSVEDTEQVHPKTDEINFKEKDYVTKYCEGEQEYVLPDKTRIDCLTNDYAIEFDWASKWAEAIGQSLYYAKMTDKKPAIALILKSPSDEKYLKRINFVDENIKIIPIKTYEQQP